MQDNFGNPALIENPEFSFLSFFKKPETVDQNGSSLPTNYTQQREDLILKELKDMPLWQTENMHLPNYLYKLYYLALYEQAQNGHFDVNDVFHGLYKDFSITQFNKLTKLGLLEKKRTAGRYDVVSRIALPNKTIKEQINHYFSSDIPKDQLAEEPDSHLIINTDDNSLISFMGLDDDAIEQILNGFEKKEPEKQPLIMLPPTNDHTFNRRRLFRDNPEESDELPAPKHLCYIPRYT